MIKLAINKSMLTKTDTNELINKMTKLIDRVIKDHHIAWRTQYDTGIKIKIDILDWDLENSGVNVFIDALINGELSLEYIKEFCEQIQDDPYDVHPLMQTIQVIATQITELC